MSKHWSQITNDEMLNYQDSNTSVITRYERIMSHHTIDALVQVRAGLHDVKVAMHACTDRLETQIKSAVDSQNAASAAQGRMQRVTVGLTIAIAVATVAYTLITFFSVLAQREANQIQREALAVARATQPTSR
jgi:hypothetical protein